MRLENLEGRCLLASIGGTVFNDILNDGVFGGVDQPMAGVPVFLDLNNNGLADTATQTIASTDVPKAILDLNTVFSNLTVAGVPGTIADVNVTLSLTHTWNEDLDVFLVHPDGTLVELFTDVGGNSDNFINTVLDDEAATSITAGTAPFTGTFRPEGLLSTLDGKNANGLWRLRITDDTGGDVGSLSAWSIGLTAVGEPSTTTDAAGQYSFTGLAAGTYSVVETLPAGFEAFAPASGIRDVTVADADAATADFANRRTPSTIYGTVFNDLDADGVIDGGESPQAGVTVFLDLNENGAVDTNVLAPIASTDVPKAILDVNTVFSNLNVAGVAGALADVDVRLSLTHTWNEDLDVFLVHPDGTLVELFTDVGGNSDNFINTVLDDEAATSISAGVAPFTGSFRPEGPLSALDGKGANGLWRLRITDDAAGDVGTLSSWSLTFSTAVEPSTVTDAAGQYFFSGLAAGTYPVVELPPAGQTPTIPVGGTQSVTIGTGETISGVNFGNRLAPATISGRLFNDYDNNGVEDPGEPGLPGVTVFLDLDGDDVLDDGEQSTTSDANGDYVFLEVAPNVTYQVRQITPAGFVQTAPLIAGGVTPGPNVNVSRRATNQTESSAAIDPTNPNRMFIAANTETGNEISVARSSDGGSTWTSGVAFAGVACCDPTLAWDSYGNLFMAILDASIRTDVYMSVDGGANFTFLADLGGSDQPTIVVGPSGLGDGSGSVWVTLNVGGQIRATGARVTGLGAVQPFGALSPNLGGGNFGDIAVGDDGEVFVTYQNPAGGQGPSTIFGNLDPDGLGPAPFGAQTVITSTNVGGFDFIPAQPDRSVDSEAGLAYDRSGGPNDGRLYLVYTEETAPENNDLDILVRFSDNNGGTWSAPTRVNDDATTRSQFLPRIALDQTNGHVGVTFYDARNSPGNDTAEFFAAVSTDGGATWSANAKVSAGVSDQDNAPAPPAGIADLDYGDYSGLAFHAGRLLPSWADNSNSQGDSVGGAGAFEIYTSVVTVGTLNFYPVRPTPGQSLADRDFGDHDIVAPSVADVRVRIGSRTVSVLGQTRTLPWVNISRIEMQFSEDVLVDQDDLVLTGISVPEYVTTAFSYDAASRTATWTLGAAPNIDRITVRLDGTSAMAVADPSGNLLAGGTFSHLLKVLPGDFNGDGVVTSSDIGLIARAIGSSIIFGDIDGDGDVDLNDVAIARRRNGTKLV